MFSVDQTKDGFTNTQGKDWKEESAKFHGREIDLNPSWKLKLGSFTLTCCTVIGASMCVMCNHISNAYCSEEINQVGQILLGIGIAPLIVGSCCLVALNTLDIKPEPTQHPKIKKKREESKSHQNIERTTNKLRKLNLNRTRNLFEDLSSDDWSKA
jgi:hypothetical protein